MPLKRMRWPWISIVSPSMTDATPAIVARPALVQFGRWSSGMWSLCCMAVCAARAPAAATVTKIRRLCTTPSGLRRGDRILRSMLVRLMSGAAARFRFGGTFTTSPA